MNLDSTNAEKKLEEGENLSSKQWLLLKKKLMGKFKMAVEDDTMVSLLLGTRVRQDRKKRTLVVSHENLAASCPGGRLAFS